MSARNQPDFGWDYAPGCSDADLEPAPALTIDDDPSDDHYDDAARRSAMMASYYAWMKEHPLKGKWYDEP